jgi:hypothetical protein
LGLPGLLGQLHQSRRLHLWDLLGLLDLPGLPDQ